MLVAVVLLAVVAAGLAVALALVGRRRAVAEALAAERAEELAATRGEVETLTAELGTVRTELGAAHAATTKERARADAALAQATAEQRRAADAAARATTAQALAADAEASLAAMRRALDPPGLWVFERQRLCRVWHDWVSVTLDAACPLAEEPTDAVVEAVAILASASREECGVPIDVVWDLTDERRRGLGLEGVLVVLRAVEELIAAARGSDGAGLALREADGQADELELRLTPEPPRSIPQGLASSSLDVGWHLVEQDGALVLRVPVPAPRPA